MGLDEEMLPKLKTDSHLETYLVGRTDGLNSQTECEIQGSERNQG